MVEIAIYVLSSAKILINLFFLLYDVDKHVNLLHVLMFYQKICYSNPQPISIKRRYLDNMQRVPNFTVLFFLEWIKKYNLIDISLEQLFLDEKYSNRALELATEFLNTLEKYDEGCFNLSTTETRAWLYTLLHSSVDSFLKSSLSEEYINDLSRVIPYYTDPEERRFPSSLCRYYCSHAERKMSIFSKTYPEDISPRKLIIGVRNQLKMVDPDFIHLCLNYNYYNNNNYNILLTIWFLEWIKLKKPQLGNNDLTKVPAEQFTKWIEEYISEVPNISPVDKKQLLSLPHQIRDQNPLILKIKEILATYFEKDIDLRLLITRYLDPEIKFRCVFLPLPSTGDQASRNLGAFVEQNWPRLNDMTGGVMDLYYSVSDLDICQFEGPLKYLSDKCAKAKILSPALALWDWESGIENSVFISLIDLNDKDGSDILRIFNIICNEIRSNKNITPQSIKNAVDRGIIQLKRDKKPDMNVNNNNQIFIGGDNNIVGSQEIHNKSTQETQYIDRDIFSKEVNEVIPKINELADLELKQKEYLIELLNAALQARKDNDRSQQEMLKALLKSYICGLGQFSSNLLTTLGSFASIASFFGIPIILG